MRGATNAARDQRETNLLTASLEMTLATLAGAERSLARTEERVNMHRRLLKEEVVKANKAKRAPPPMPSAPATAEKYYPTGYIEGEQHLEAGQVDPSIAMTRPVVGKFGYGTAWPWHSLVVGAGLKNDRSL